MDLRDKKSTVINIVFYSLILGLALFGLKYLLPLFLPFLIGFFVAMILKTPSAFISKKTHISQKAVSLILPAVLFLFLGLLLYLLGGRIIKEGSDLLKKLPFVYSAVISPFIERIINTLSENLSPYVSTDTFFKSLTAAIDSFSVKLTDFTADFVTKFLMLLPSFVISVIFSIISTFFFSLDYYKVTSFLAKLLPKRLRSQIFETKKICLNTFKNMLKGYGIILAVTFFELIIGFSLLRVENALVLSIIVALLDILPIIGSGTFLIPMAIFGFLYQRVYLSIGLLLLYAIITVIRNIIEPKIIGKKIGIHPITMLLSIYIGGKIGGFLGIIILPAAVTVLKESFKEDMANEELRL